MAKHEWSQDEMRRTTAMGFAIDLKNSGCIDDAVETAHRIEKYLKNGLEGAARPAAGGSPATSF